MIICCGFVVDSTSADLSTSPIFPCRQLAGQQSATSAPNTSGSISKLSDVNHSSSGASPWLSKERAISNGKAVTKTVAQKSGYEQNLVLILLMLDYAVFFRCVKWFGYICCDITVSDLTFLQAVCT